MRDLTGARVLELVNRVDRAATRVVAGWLERDDPASGRPPQLVADLSGLVGRVPPSIVVNAHLMWRGTALELLQEQADRGGTERSLIDQARIVLADRCDTSLVAVARQFDEPRDQITGLANHAAFVERTQHALRSAERYGDAVGLIAIELDPGEHAEEILVEAANRLRRVSRSTDLIAHLGGGRFVICCERLRSELEAVAIADRASLALSQPYTAAGEEIHPPSHVGIAVSHGGDDAESLLADAGAARQETRG
jgi:diguanylate cyclase (GGDEF)-like protein